MEQGKAALRRLCRELAWEQQHPGLAALGQELMHLGVPHGRNKLRNLYSSATKIARAQRHASEFSLIVCLCRIHPIHSWTHPGRFVERLLLHEGLDAVGVSRALRTLQQRTQQKVL